MNHETANQTPSPPSRKDDGSKALFPGLPEGGGGQTLSGREILLVFAAIALVCVGGYFFLMKMIAVSQQEDCILAHRRNCGTPQVIFSR